MKKKWMKWLFMRNYELRKILSIMRLSLILLFCGLQLASAKVGAQAKVTVGQKEVTYLDLFAQIKEQTGFTVVYSNNELDKNKVIKAGFVGMELKEVLDNVLAGTGLCYELMDEFVILKIAPKEEKKMLKIIGVVTDKSKLPLPGVTVTVKGTTLGTATDMDGRYQLMVPQIESIALLFSFVGMETQEVKYVGKDTINVVMKESAELLDEVVVYTGYQKIDKRHLSSAVTSIRMDEIKTPGVSTVDQLLQGRVPGMIFMQNSGQVGAAPKLRIRGTSTVLGNQEPLWVVDGIIQTDPVNVDPARLNDLDFVNLLGNAISGLNPDDIEQIDVLKDASATALYGTRAGNGVIVITTRKGKQGPPRISYSVTGTLSRRPRYSDKAVNMMNSKERIDVSREMIERKMHYTNVTNWIGYEAAYLDFSNGRIGFDEYKRLVDRYETINTDWFDIICKDAFSHSHTLSLSGGSENIKYYASIGYNDDASTLRGEGTKRYTTSLNVSADYNKWYVQFALSGSSMERHYNPSSLNLMSYAYTTSRAIPLRNEDGSLYYYERGNTQSYLNGFNVVNEMNNSDDNMITNSLNVRANLVYKILSSLRLDATFSYGTSNSNQEIWYGENSYYIQSLRGDRTERNDLAPMGGELQKSDVRNKSYTARVQVNFDKNLDKDYRHMLSVSGGAEVSSTSYNSFNIIRRGYLKDRGKTFADIPTTNTGFYEWLRQYGTGTITESESNKVGLYATVGYIYDNRYVVNLSVRSDATNNFGSRSNFLPTWGASARWEIKEDLFKDVEQIDVLALKASVGYQGNMLESESPNLIIEHGIFNNVYEDNTATVKNFPNPNLKYEKKLSTNYSLDFSFWNRLVNGSVSYFYNKTKNAFLNKTVSKINGVSQYVVNRGNISNTGFELVLNFTPINNLNGSAEKRGFTWRFDPQFGQVVNKLIKRAINNRNNVFQDEITYNDLLNGSLEIANKPLGTFYSYKFQGLEPENGKPLFYNTNQEEFEEKYNSMESKEDVYFMVLEESGTRIPVLQGGVSNYFGYRNFSLSFNFTYSFGNKIRLLKMCSEYATQTPSPYANMRREFVNRWRRPGDENKTNIPALVVNDGSIMVSTQETPWWLYKSYSFASDRYQMYDNSDIRVVNGRYLRLQSLQFQYRLEDSFCKKLRISSAYVTLSGTNLFTWCAKELKGQDPEQSGTSDVINLSVRPTYSLNLNVTF